MPYQFPADLEERINAHLASGRYQSRDELLADAMDALDELHTRHEQLRREVQSRVAKAGQVQSQILDRDAFKAEARRRAREER